MIIAIDETTYAQVTKPFMRNIGHRTDKFGRCRSSFDEVLI